MEMFYIILLLTLGVLFLVAEIVLLPGISIGGILSLVCYGSSIYIAFRDFGSTIGCIVIVIVLVLSVLVTIFSLRAKTWQRFSLKQQIDSQSMIQPNDQVEIGARGVTISRLSPMGKVEIDGRIYEAKSVDVYVDPRSDIEVIGFENFNVIVKIIK